MVPAAVQEGYDLSDVARLATEVRERAAENQALLERALDVITRTRSAIAPAPVRYGRGGQLRTASGARGRAKVVS